MEPFTPILKINPSVQSWKAKVQVIDKIRPRDSTSSTPTTYQNVILQDEIGTKVLAFIYNNDIALLHDTLEPFKTYTIRNAKVRNPRPMTKLPDPEYQYIWTISGSTPITYVKGHVSSTLSNFSQITPFTDLYKSIGTQSEIDVLAVVIDKLPSKKVKNKAGEFTEINEFIIVDQQAKPIVLTLWTDFIKHDGDRITQELKSKPVILAKRLSVTLFYGMSLATKANSSFHINPSVKEATSLRSWAMQNNQLLAQLVKKRAHQYVLRDLVNPLNQHYLDIKDLPSSLDKTKSLWVKGKLMIMTQEQQFHYLACENCGKGTRAEYKEPFRCMHCVKDSIAVPRFKFEADVIDDTGSITVAVFGENGRQIFSLEPEEILSKQQAGETLQIEEVNKQLWDKTFLIQLRSQTFDMDGESHLRFSVAWLYDEQQVCQQKSHQVESSSSNLSRDICEDPAPKKQKLE